MNKYVHVRGKHEGTIAVVIPTKQYLTDLFLTHSNMGCITAGVTKLHPNDQFCKKTGREQADNKCMPRVAMLSDIEITGTRHQYYFTFKLEDSNCVDSFSLVFGTTAESDNVHLLAGYMYASD